MRQWTRTGSGRGGSSIHTHPVTRVLRGIPKDSNKGQVLAPSRTEYCISSPTLSGTRLATGTDLCGHLGQRQQLAGQLDSEGTELKGQRQKMWVGTDLSGQEQIVLTKKPDREHSPGGQSCLLWVPTAHRPHSIAPRAHKQRSRQNGVAGGYWNRLHVRPRVQLTSHSRGMPAQPSSQTSSEAWRSPPLSQQQVATCWLADYTGVSMSLWEGPIFWTRLPLPCLSTLPRSRRSKSLTAEGTTSRTI